MNIKLFSLIVVYNLISNFGFSQFNSCYYFKSEIAGYYYKKNINDSSYYYLQQLSNENKILTRGDYFKMAAVKSRLNISNYKDDLKNYLRYGGELKYILNNKDLLKNITSEDSINFVEITDSIISSELNNIKLNNFLKTLEICTELSNLVRNENKKDLYFIVDSISYVCLVEYLLNEKFMENLNPSPKLNSKLTQLLAFLMHASYYSSDMSNVISSICFKLLSKNILRPVDYWNVHYRRLEVLDKGKVKEFEKGNKEDIKKFRLSIGMLLDESININLSLLNTFECVN